jgi:hypothetical protein
MNPGKDVATDVTSTAAQTTEATAENTIAPKQVAVKKATPAKKKVEAKKVAVKKAPAKKVAVKKVAKKATAVKKAAPVKKAPAKAKRTADNFNRDFGRVKFNGETFSKGRAVHALVVAFVEKKNPTLAQLKDAFPDTLVKNYGVVQEISKAKKFSHNGVHRYYLGKEDFIVTKDGKTVVTTNQFSSENIKPVIKHAKPLGFTLTPQK